MPLSDGRICSCSFLLRNAACIGDLWSFKRLLCSVGIWHSFHVSFALLHGYPSFWCFFYDSALQQGPSCSGSAVLLQPFVTQSPGGAAASLYSMHCSRRLLRSSQGNFRTSHWLLYQSLSFLNRGGEAVEEGSCVSTAQSPWISTHPRKSRTIRKDGKQTD